MENVTLFSTEKHTQALEAITGKPEEKVLILVGPEDSGKTQLLKWLAEEISSDEKHLVFYHEICPHEHPSHFLFRFLLHLLNGTNFVSSRIGWEDIKKKFPGEGEFLNVLFNKDIRPFKHKLLEALKYMGSLDDQKKIVWIIDPRPRLESEETSSFFADVKDKLPPNIKVVIGQRDGDVLSQRQDIFPTIFLGEVDTEKKEEYLTEWSRGSLLPKDIMEKTIENQDCILGLQLTTHLFDMIGQDCSSQDVPKMVQTFYEEAQWLGASKILDWLSLVPFFIPSSELSAISETDEKELDSLIDDPFLSPFLERDDNRIRLGNNRLASLLSKDMIERGKDVNDYLKKHFLYLIDSLQHEKDRDNDELKEDLLRCSYLLQAIQDKDFFLAHFRELYKIMDRYGFNDGIEEILKKAISFQKELSGPLKDQVELLTLLGNRQRDQGDLDKALQSFQEALEMSRQSGDLEGEAEQLSRQGRIYFLHRNFEKALERHGQALYLYENVSNRLQLAREYTYIGNIYFAMKRFSEADKSFQKALEILEEVRSQAEAKKDDQEESLITREIGDVQSSLGHLYFTQGQLDTALRHHQKALELFKKLGQETRSTHQWAYVGHIQYARQEFSKAIKAYEHALSGYEKENDRLGKALILGSLGHVYYAMRNVEKSAKFHEESLEIHKELKNLAGEANQLSSLGRIFQDQGKLKEAKERFENALKIRRELQDRMGESAQLISLAEISFMEDDLDGAQQNYQAALTIARELGNSYNEAKILVEMGNLMFAKQMFEEAEKSFVQARDIYKRGNYREKEATVVGHMGMLKRYQKKDEEALKHFEEGLAISKELNRTHGMANFIANIGIIYYERKDFKKALDYYDEALKLYRKIDDFEGTANILSNIATVHYYQGNMDLASKNYEEALTILRNIRHAPGIASLLRNVSYVYVNQEKYDLAVKSLHETINILQRMGLPEEAKALKKEVDRIEKLAEESLERMRKEMLLKPAKKRKKIGRNDPCPCRSGKKYKKCCGA